MSSAPQRADAAFVNQLSVLLFFFVKDYQKDNSPIMLGSIACVKRCSSWYFLSPSDRFNVLQIDFSIDNSDEHKRGEVLREHHYCSSNAISALALNSTIRYANFTLAIFVKLRSRLIPISIHFKCNAHKGALWDHLEVYLKFAWISLKCLKSA